MILHRPKCGDLLSPSPDGYLECIRGRMPLAQELEERLRECYVLRTRQPRELIFTYAGQPHRIGGQWFCPGCRVEAQELTPGDLHCPACHRSLVEFIESLIERHPHFDGTGGWR